eukprot:SM000060S19664  [mRNA]  locus=s60:481594:483853:+ [translate_table: standard]
MGAAAEPAAPVAPARLALTTLLFPVHPPRQPGIEAWYMDDSAEDQRLEHRLSPNQPVSSSKLDDLGVLQWHLDADQWESDPKLAAIREERGYSYHDVIAVAPDKLPNYEQKIKGFFEEHLHTDEEIRYVLEGSGYFDVRDKDEKWIRIKCCKGDMIVLPAGIYHRFTLDSNNYIKALRLFVGEPVWTPHNRPADHLDARQAILHGYPGQGPNGVYHIGWQLNFSCTRDLHILLHDL